MDLIVIDDGLRLSSETTLRMRNVALLAVVPQRPNAV